MKTELMYRNRHGLHLVDGVISAERRNTFQAGELVTGIQLLQQLKHLSNMLISSTRLFVAKPSDMRAW